VHPCLACGACCAAFRVAFHWSLAAPHHPEGPDESMTVRVRPFELAMRGTEGGTAPRCVALRGEVGVAVQCGIYARRPPPCRELEASWEHGRPSPQCDRARARHGLPPLGPGDFPASRTQAHTGALHGDHRDGGGHGGCATLG
jgi:hypothetical protein